MNSATATANAERIERVLADAAWQIGERVLALFDRAAAAPARLLRRLAGLPRAWREATEGRRAEQVMTRLGAHQLRDLGLRPGDVALMRCGVAPSRREG